MGLPILFLRNLQSVRSSIWICTYDSFLVNLPRALILPVQGRVVNQFYFKSGQVLRNNFKVPGVGAAQGAAGALRLDRGHPGGDARRIGADAGRPDYAGADDPGGVGVGRGGCATG